VTRHDGPYWVANGPAISADGRTLFHTDSAAREVFAFDLSPQGELANKRVHIRFSDRDGYPDGMTSDAEGGLWIAHWDGGRITRFDASLLISQYLYIIGCFGEPVCLLSFRRTTLLRQETRELVGVFWAAGAAKKWSRWAWG
jgi:hypothetical protein